MLLVHPMALFALVVHGTVLNGTDAGQTIHKPHCRDDGRVTPHAGILGRRQYVSTGHAECGCVKRPSTVPPASSVVMFYCRAGRMRNLRSAMGITWAECIDEPAIAG